jgi:DNA-binding GntR family transcriptional regulator
MQASLERQRKENAEGSPAALALIRGRGATIAMQIYRHLRGQIVAGEYAPLHALSESELAARFGVSRTPVREALGKLEEEGLISIQPQYGTFVAPVRIDRVAGDQFVREALECAAVRVASLKCTKADAESLRAILQTQRSCETDKAFFGADEAMHRALLGLAGYEAAWHVLDAAKVNLDRIRHLSVRQMFKRQLILKEHDRIIAAVIAGDPDEAAAAMRDHLRGVFASSEQMMRAHPEFFQANAADRRPARRRRVPPGEGLV